MVYSPQTHVDLPATSPGSRAARLNHMESGINDAGGAVGGVAAAHVFPDVALVETVYAPTITTTSSTGSAATSISGGITAADMLAASPHNLMTGKVGLIGTKRTNLVAIAAGFYAPNWKCASNGTSGTAIYPTSSWGVQFYCAGTRYVEILAGGPETSYLHAWVDDRMVTVLPQTPSWTVGGVTNKYKIDHGALNDGAPHLVRIMLHKAGLAKIFVESTGNIWEAPPPGPRVFYLGDSIGGYTANTGYELGSWFPRFCNIAGIRDFWNGTLPGTGPNNVNGGFLNYKTRATTDATPSDADQVIVTSWYNDRAAGRTPAQIAADTDTICTTLNAMSSSPQIIVASPYEPGGTAGSSFTNIDDAVQPVCEAAGAAYISFITGKCWDYNGDLLIQDGQTIYSGNLNYHISADNIHFNDRGHKYLAHRWLGYYKRLSGAV